MHTQRSNFKSKAVARSHTGKAHGRSPGAQYNPQFLDVRTPNPNPKSFPEERERKARATGKRG